MNTWNVTNMTTQQRIACETPGVYSQSTTTHLLLQSMMGHASYQLIVLFVALPEDGVPNVIAMANFSTYYECDGTCAEDLTRFESAMIMDKMTACSN